MQIRIPHLLLLDSTNLCVVAQQVSKSLLKFCDSFVTHCHQCQDHPVSSALHYKHTSFYCVLQILWVFVRFFFFFKQMEGLWQPCIELVYQHHFSNSICSLHVSVNITSVCNEKWKKLCNWLNCDICFTWWSRTKPAIPLRYACILFCACLECTLFIITNQSSFIYWCKLIYYFLN